MPSPIVERILTEYRARASAREAIANSKGGPSQPPVAPLPLGADEISRLAAEVVPIIGQAVSSEISSALDRVRRDLLNCLERELCRLSTPAPAQPDRAPAEAAALIESVDTDLDLTTDDVNQQLDRVFDGLIPAPAQPGPDPSTASADPPPAAAGPAPPPADLRTPMPGPTADPGSGPAPGLRPGDAGNDHQAIEELREAILDVRQFLHDHEKDREPEAGRAYGALAEERGGARPDEARAPKGGADEDRAPAEDGAKALAQVLAQIRETEKRIIARIDSVIVQMGECRS